MSDAQVKSPRVLIAVPTIGMHPDPNLWLKSFLAVLQSVKRMGCTHACLFPYRLHWFVAMNQVFNTAFEHDFDYILRMDDDVWGMGEHYFETLFKADKDVIGCCYPIRHFPYTYAALVNEGKNGESIIDAYTNNRHVLAEVEGTGIKKVDLIGFGMTLIKTEKFKMVPRPLFPKEEKCPDDTYFAQICADNKIEQYVHMDLKLAHREVTPMNRTYLLNSDARMLIQAGAIKSDGTDYSQRFINAFGEDGKKDPGMLKTIV